MLLTVVFILKSIPVVLSTSTNEIPTLYKAVVNAVLRHYEREQSYREAIAGTSIIHHEGYNINEGAIPLKVFKYSEQESDDTQKEGSKIFFEKEEDDLINDENNLTKYGKEFNDMSKTLENQK